MVSNGSRAGRTLTAEVFYESGFAIAAIALSSRHQAVRHRLRDAAAAHFSNGMIVVYSPARMAVVITPEMLAPTAYGSTST
jgi:hypothetical protein